MFPDLPRRDPGAEAVARLAEALIAGAGRSTNNRKVPAGYTYFGQFVDHDITFDPTSKLQRDNDPAALVDFRTPRFDLDSVYGSGPADQPYLYDWSKPSRGLKLLIEDDDLPRNSQGRALVGDARNDENVVVSQLHLLFLRFHNKVVDHVRDRSPLEGAELFEEAQRLVRWHYQWVVVHDFLPRVVGEATAAVERRFFEWSDAPFMPVEFSGAAYRFGHTMVRERYQLNAATAPVPPFPAPGPPDEHLGGFRARPPALTIEWDRFFDVGPAAPGMHSMRIDDSLAAVLMRVPPAGAALPRLNLERGRALGLPAGTDVAHALGERALTDEELLPEAIDGPARDALLRAPPLWYYVLREAAVLGEDGLRLGPVGGRIVAEVLIGLLEGDPGSYRREWPTWTPELPSAAEDDFTMGDLVRFTLEDG